MNSKRLSKRFYQNVTVEGEGREWRVLLDGMQLRTPGKLKLSLPSRALAEKLAGEWEAQGERINPSLMPLTRLINVAVEQTPGRRQDLIAEARRYAETDLLCYRAPQPRILQERQAEAWDDWREWGAAQGVDLKTTESLHVIAQPEASLKAVEDFAIRLDDIRLTLFVHLIAVYGSVILAMAVMRSALSGEAAFHLSRIDAVYQIELWGEDEEQAEITADLRNETQVLSEILEIL